VAWRRWSLRRLGELVCVLCGAHLLNSNIRQARYFVRLTKPLTCHNNNILCTEPFGIRYRPDCGLSSHAAALIELLGQTIVAVDRRPNNELSLAFSGKATLLLTVDEQGFESYHLHVGGESVDITKA
jgi:hypothetical protein